jgi:SAM-dependent methyltransferase
MEATMTSHETAYSRSFGGVAELYDRSRPRYASEALRWALGPTPLDVVDLGAGTGILTRQLTALRHRCTTVEPDPQMLSLCRRTTKARVLSGSAEDIPLPDASVDAVVAGECYHWFNPDQAHAEIARVLRPGGVFAALWNVRDERTPWVADLNQILDRYDRTKTAKPAPAVTTPFGPVVRKEFIHTVEYTLDALLDLYRSHSYYIAAPPSVRDALERDLRHLVRTHPDLQECTRLALPYTTLTYRSAVDGGA